MTDKNENTGRFGGPEAATRIAPIPARTISPPARKAAAIGLARQPHRAARPIRGTVAFQAVAGNATAITPTPAIVPERNIPGHAV
jgi:hypothetical protein